MPNTLQLITELHWLVVEGFALSDALERIKAPAAVIRQALIAQQVTGDPSCSNSFTLT